MQYSQPCRLCDSQRTCAAVRGTGWKAYCPRTLLLLCCLCLSEECQFTLRSGPLIISVEALSQLDGGLDVFVSKERAHLKEVCSPNASGTCLSWQYPTSNPQPPSALPALLPAFLRLTPWRQHATGREIRAVVTTNLQMPEAWRKPHLGYSRMHRDHSALVSKKRNLRLSNRM